VQKFIQLIPKILPVYMNRDEWIGQIVLKDAIRAVHRAVHIQIYDEIITPYVSRSTGTGFDKVSFLGSKKEY
jgi:hypothetical protein